MTEANLGLALSGLPLAVAWLLERALKSRAAVRSLRLRAALLASIAVALLPILPLRAPRPSWMPKPLALRSNTPDQTISASTDVQESAPAIAPAAPVEPDLGSQTQRGTMQAAPSMEREPSESGVVESAARSTKSNADSALGWERIAIGIWLGGALVLLAWSACCHFQIARLRRNSQVLAGGEVFEEAALVAREWKMKAPLLLLSSGISSPFASGVWRASICWPESMQSPSDGEQWRAILRHEMAHCRRHDCAWNALAQVARAMLWPQPMLWWTCQAIRKNSEDVCDEAALEGCAPTAYARGLLELSQRLQGASTCGAANRAASAGALPPQPELSRRVTRILKLRGSDAWRIGWRTRAATIGALCAVIGASVLATSSEAPRAQEAAASTLVAAPVRVDLSSPQATLDTFVAAVRARDAQALSQCVETVNSAEDLQQTAKYSLQRLMNVSAWRVAVQGEEATATATVTADARDGQVRRGTLQSTATLRLRRGAEGWRIVSDPSRYAYGRSDPLTWAAQIVADPTIKRLHDWAREHGRAIVEGQVLLPGGSPAAKAKVRLEMDSRLRQRLVDSPLGYVMYPPPLSRMMRLSATTDARGFYRIEGVAGVAYSVCAFWPAATTDISRGAFDSDADVSATHIAAPQKLSPREGEVVRAPVLTALPAARLEVLVVDASDGTPISGAKFGAAPKQSSYFSMGYKATGADGRVALSVAQGTIRLGLMSQSIGQHGSFGATVARGRYTNGHGSTVQFDSKKAINWNGYTTITTVAGQSRRITVRLMPLSALPKPKPLPAPRLPIPTSGRGSGVLIGRVQFDDGRPAPNVAVVATMQQAARWDLMRRLGLAMTSDGKGWDRLDKLAYFKAVTDARGEFRLSGLIGAPYDLLTSTPGEEVGLGGAGAVGGKVSVAVQGVWARDKATIRRAQPIVLVAGAIIRGRITDKATGAGVAGVTVGCYGPHRPRSSESVAGTNSRSDGTFELRVAPGKNEIYLSGPSSRDASENFRFADDGHRANVYVLTLPRRLFYAGGGDSQLDGGATRTDTRGATMFAISAQRGETHTLNFQLRRLRPATAAEDSEE